MIVKLSPQTPRKDALRRARKALSMEDLITVRIQYADTEKLRESGELVIDRLIQDIVPPAVEVERGELHVVLKNPGPDGGVAALATPDPGGIPAVELELAVA